MKIKKKAVYNIGLFICLIYILLRPFLNTYVTEYIKYIFILAMVYYAAKGISKKDKMKEIGYLEIALCMIFAIYALVSSIIAGGFELFGYTLERYVFYMIPLFVIPAIKDKVNWEKVLLFLSWYGVVDAITSIVEFITHRQLFSIEGVRHNIVQLYGDNSIRTFGLNGSYFLLAELLTVCGLASLFLYLFKSKKSELWKFILISIGIFTTGSRGYYVAYFVGICLMLWIHNTEKGLSRKSIIKLFSLLIAVFVLLFIVFYTDMTTGISMIDTILSRARSITDFSTNLANAQRYSYWIKSIQKWRQNPVFGIGASCTDPRYSRFEFVTESGLLKRLVELGIVGALLQYATMLILLFKGIKRYKINKKGNVLNVFFICVIAALLVEDIALQRYGEIEHTIIMWSSLAFIATSMKAEKNQTIKNYERNRGHENLYNTCAYSKQR